MLDWIKKLILSKYVQSLIRHLMTLLAGILISIGLDPEIVEQFATSGTAVLIGLAAYLIGQAWSWLEKKKQE